MNVHRLKKVLTLVWAGLGVVAKADTPPDGLVISEFLARNDTGLTDEDGDTSDWIEIVNDSLETVDLSDWHLTDDPTNLTRWTFPAVTIAPGEYLLVFASGKDRIDPAGTLHTNFSLAGSGEFLALVAPDGATLASAFQPAFPPQLDDTSYGFENGGEREGFFTTPTPGAANTTSIGLVLQPPVFSEESGILAGRITLEASLPSNDPPGAAIHYTTDGTAPTPASPVWPGSLRILTSTRLKAAAFDPSGTYDPSPVVTRQFIRLNSNVSSFNSNLPIVVLDSFGTDVDGLGKTNFFSNAFATFIDVDDSGRAAITGTPDFVGNSGIRVRGSSSAWLFPKKQYRFETWNDQGNDLDVSLFGLPAESDWILNAPWSDKTMMRNHLAYRQGEKMGGYSPRTRFFELFFNADGGAVDLDDYQGIYLLVERIKISNDRLDLAEMSPSDNEEPGVSGGFILRKDRIAAGDRSVTTGIENVPLLFQEPEAPTTAQFVYLRNYLNAFEAALHGPDSADPLTGFRAYIDEDSWIDQHLLTEGLRNADGYRLSTHYYKDRNGLLKAGPPWDFNLALGNASFNGAQSPTGWHYEEVDPNRFLPPYPWYGRMFEDPAFTLAYWDRYFQIRTEQWDTPTFMAEIDEVAAYLSAEATEREFARWDTLGRDTYANAPGYQNRLTYQSEVDAMKTFLTDRFAWMDTQFTPPPSFSLAPGPLSPGTPLTLFAPGSPAIHYTIDGSDPASEGSASRLYQSPLVLDQSTWVKARVRHADQTWGALATGRFMIEGRPVVSLSEIHYRPAPATPAEEAAGYTRNDFEFLELFNPTGTTLTLTGARFVDGIRFTFGEFVLPPEGRTLLVSNLAAFESRFGDPSALSIAGQFEGNLDNDGEMIVLEDQDRRVLLSLTYNDAPPWPATPDGDGPSLVLRHPTLDPDQPGSWRPSLAPGGTPGSSDHLPFAGDPEADDNANGISNLIEYALGSTPPALTTDGENFSFLSVARRLGSDDAFIRFESSPDLGPGSWTPTEPVVIDNEAGPPGFETITFSLPPDLRQFVRVVVTLH